MRQQVNMRISMENNCRKVQQYRNIVYTLMAKYADGTASSPVNSTARNTSPNWQSREESTTLQLRLVACDTTVKLPSASMTLSADENLGAGNLSGPPPLPQITSSVGVGV